MTCQRKSWLSLSFLLILVSAGQLRAQTATSSKGVYTGPQCIAHICFSSSQLLDQKQFVQKYGSSRSDKGVYCYQIPSQGLYARFEASQQTPEKIVEVFISKKRNCYGTLKILSPYEKFSYFVTPEGVGLGDSYSKVVSAYGKPTSKQRGTGLEMRGLDYSVRWKSDPFGKEVLIYAGAEDEPISAQFYFKDAKLSAILISAND